MTKPVLVEIAGLRLVVAAYTDGFDYYLAQDELGEISWASRGGFPRVAARRAGGWQVEPGPAGPSARPTVLDRAIIHRWPHYLTGERWPWPLLGRGPAAGVRPVAHRR